MNLTELARFLEVSPTTVSRVLNGHAEKFRISSNTVDRVREAAARFSVSPDPLGTSLRRGKLGSVGLLVPDITNPFFSQLAREAELALREGAKTVQLCDAAEDEATEMALLRQILAGRLDGLLLAPVGNGSDAFRELVNTATMPVVVVDRTVPGLEVDSVSLDNFHAGKLAAGHLIEAGHRRLGCLRGDPGSFIDRERFRGVVAAVEEAGLVLEDRAVAGTGYSQESGLEGARAILRCSDGPSAVVTLSGHGILGILRASSELSLRVPADISVVAFDEQPWSAYVNPPLDTIEQPIAAMTRRAVELLAKKETSPGNGGEVHTFTADLIVRESVRRL